MHSLRTFFYAHILVKYVITFAICFHLTYPHQTHSFQKYNWKMTEIKMYRAWTNIHAHVCSLSISVYNLSQKLIYKLITNKDKFKIQVINNICLKITPVAKFESTKTQNNKYRIFIVVRLWVRVSANSVVLAKQKRLNRSYDLFQMYVEVCILTFDEIPLYQHWKQSVKCLLN